MNNEKYTEKLDYIQLESRIITRLNQERYIVVATLSKNTILNRRVTYVNSNLNIGIFKWKNSGNPDQYKKGSYAGLCLPGKIDLQIDGKIINFIDGISGNNHLINLYKYKLPETYLKIEKANNFCFLEIMPSVIKLLEYINNKLFLSYLEIEKEMAYRKLLSIW